MGEEFDRTIFIMETGPGPPHERPRWYCHQHQPGFDTPEEGVAWALTQSDLVMVSSLAGIYYWAGTEPTEWDEQEWPLRPWPPSDEERQEIDANYALKVRRLAEVNEIAPRLAEAIADRLAKVLPVSWSAHARFEEGPEVVITRDGEAERAVGGVGDFEIEDIYVEILSQAQDEIAEETTDAWPGGPRSRHLWMPDAEVIDDQVHAWFGPKDDPVLTLEPIDLAAIRAGSN
jgi:hypothetical protein